METLNEAKTSEDYEKIPKGYSAFIIEILNDTKIQELMKESHRIRFEDDLKKISDLELIISALKMYNRKKARRQRKKSEKTWKFKGQLTTQNLRDFSKRIKEDCAKFPSSQKRLEAKNGE